MRESARVSIPSNCTIGPSVCAIETYNILSAISQANLTFHPMAGSSPEDDSKPPARSDHLRQHQQQECEAKFDPGSVDPHTAIANLLYRQSHAQHNLFAGAQQQWQEVPTSSSYPYATYGADLPDHALSLIPNASAPQVYSFEQDAARIQQQSAILQQQSPLMLLPQQHLLQTLQGLPPYTSFAERGRLLQQFQLQSQLPTINAFRDSQLMNELGGTGQPGSLAHWYNDPPYSAVPYSGVAAAAEDIARALPPNFDREQIFAETVRNQAAHLQRENFAESNSFAKSKISRAKAKQKKPKDKGQPKRPLSAYNIFFQEERAKILRQIPDKKLPKRRNNKNPNRSGPHGKISFEDMAKTIGAAWRQCPEEMKAHYKELAEKDTERYLAEKEAWKSQQSAEMTQQQQLLQQQVDSQTMREYIRHEEQQQRKVDGKSSSCEPSTGSVSGQRLPSPDDDKSLEES